MFNGVIGNSPMKVTFIYYWLASNPDYTSANCETLEKHSLQRILEEAIEAHFCANVLSIIYKN